MTLISFSQANSYILKDFTPQTIMTLKSDWSERQNSGVYGAAADRRFIFCLFLLEQMDHRDLFV